LLLKTFNDRFHQRHSGFSIFKYSIWYFYWPFRSCLNYDHYLVLQVKKFGQVFPAFGQLKIRATSPNGQVGKKVVYHTVGRIPKSKRKIVSIQPSNLASQQDEKPEIPHFQNSFKILIEKS
jgi:hypothetical protein